MNFSIEVIKTSLEQTLA